MFVQLSTAALGLVDHGSDKGPTGASGAGPRRQLPQQKFRKRAEENNLAIASSKKGLTSTFTREKKTKKTIDMEAV